MIGSSETIYRGTTPLPLEGNVGEWWKADVNQRSLSLLRYLTKGIDMSRLILTHILVATLLSGISANACSAAERSQSLSAPEIQTALIDKVISYSPPGWADAGISEVFHSDGTWTGIYFSRGPIFFSGRWIIQRNEICVTPDAKAFVSKWFLGSRCRTVWRGADDKGLSIKHLDPRQPPTGPLVVSIRDLAISGR